VAVFHLMTAQVDTNIILCYLLIVKKDRTTFVIKWKASIVNYSQTKRVNSFMQSLLQKVSFYLCLRPMNNEDKMIPSAAVTA